VAVFEARPIRKHYEIDLRTREERLFPFRELLPDGFVWANYPWSFDSCPAMIFRVLHQNHGWEVARMGRDGSNFAILTSLKETVSLSAWSPTGRDALFWLVRDEVVKDRRRVIRHVAICAADGSKDATVLLRGAGYDHFAWLRDGRSFIAGVGNPRQFVLGGLPRERLKLSVAPLTCGTGSPVALKARAASAAEREVEFSLAFEVFGPNGMRLRKSVTAESRTASPGSSIVVPIPVAELPAGENVVKLIAIFAPEDRQIHFFKLEVREPPPGRQ